VFISGRERVAVGGLGCIILQLFGHVAEAWERALVEYRRDPVSSI
jgi:hypothetical protein